MVPTVVVAVSLDKHASVTYDTRGVLSSACGLTMIYGLGLVTYGGIPLVIGDREELGVFKAVLSIALSNGFKVVSIFVGGGVERESSPGAGLEYRCSSE